MTLSTNKQLELAFDYVQYTNQNIFLTGKAGTGKTTFLHRIKAEAIKRTVVVAPTGVAAINAKGQTIHSFFQLPFGPFWPGKKDDAGQQRKLRKQKLNLIRSLDLLIIDEISMVRADLLDNIDHVLRRHRDPSRPFGGVQLLMIGDLHQLPPVVKPQDWELLSPHYKTSYFFGSRALQQSNPVIIQLTHIYRQSDDVFINLLNKVRDNQLDKSVLDALNSRYIENFQPTEDEGYITLTAHNRTALEINEEWLKKLKGKTHKFTAKVDGNFSQHAYPTAEVLELKVKAQVLFIKNDTSHEKLYYNGKIGQITEITDEGVRVKCAGDSASILVNPVEWTNVKYSLDEKTKEVTEDTVGTFTQYPLKLAWAITIHKSQGLTFERAIIDAQAAFAHGQVYVALSRCKSFEGIVLRSQIGYSSVRTDGVVKDFSTKAERNKPDDAHLLEAKKLYQQTLIRELFSFKFIEKRLDYVMRVFLEHENTLTTEATEKVKEWGTNAEQTVFAFAKQFQPVLLNYFRQTDLPENNTDLLDRVQSGSGYFSKQIDEKLLPDLRAIPVITDNAKVKEQALDRLKNLEQDLFVKRACFLAAMPKFNGQSYLKTKVDAAFDFETLKKKPIPATSSTKKASEISAHPELYWTLSRWRKDMAADANIKPYEVIQGKSLMEIVDKLPADTESLLKIKGIGKVKAKQFGLDILKHVEAYCKSKGISSNILSKLDFDAAPKKVKIDTKQVSFDLYAEGKNMAEIAEVRGLTISTIEGHMAHHIGLGNINIYDIMERQLVDEVEDFFLNNKSANSAVAKKKFGEKYSYGQLKMVQQYIKLSEV